jgi:hypothetical protein
VLPGTGDWMAPAALHPLPGEDSYDGDGVEGTYIVGGDEMVENVAPECDGRAEPGGDGGDDWGAGHLDSSDEVDDEGEGAAASAQTQEKCCNCKGPGAKDKADASLIICERPACKNAYHMLASCLPALARARTLAAVAAVAATATGWRRPPRRRLIVGDLGAYEGDGEAEQARVLSHLRTSLATVRGTAPYRHRHKQDLLAFIRQKDKLPHFFMPLSVADGWCLTKPRALLRLPALQ